MAIQDLANNPILPSSASFLGYRAPDEPVFPHDIYSFLIESIRQTDRDYGRELILRWLASAQSEFEDTYARIQSLLDLFDVEKTKSKTLPFLKWIVGFTGKLDYVTTGLSEAELRRLIKSAVPMWKKKGTEFGLAQTIEWATTRKPQIVNYFDFRVLIDEVEIGRDGLGYDPWLIDVPGMAPGEKPAAVTNHTTYLKFDLTSLFGTNDETGHVIHMVCSITKHVELGVSYFDPSSGKNFVVSPSLMGQTGTPSTSPNDYRVGVDPDEFVSDLRVMDDGSGKVNRTLVETLVRLLRPSGERYWIRYVNFWDEFRRTAIDFETVSGTVVHDSDAGTILLGDGAADTVIKSDVNDDTTWTEIVASAQMQVSDSATWAELRFYYTDETNFYAVRIQPDTRTISLEKVTGSIRSTLDSVVLDRFAVNVNYFFRVSTTDTGSGHLIKYFLDENLLGEVTDADQQQGKLALACETAQGLTVRFVELYTKPLASTFIGPNEET